MKRKLLTIILTVAMLFQVCASVQAASTTPDVNSLVQKIVNGETINGNLDLAAMMQAKLSDTSNYMQQLIVSNHNNSVDIKTTLYMSSVRNLFNDFYSVVEEYDTMNSTNHLADIRDMRITGTYAITVKYPSNLQIPSEFLNGTDMYGFSEESKTIFTEVSRSEVSLGSENQLTINFQISGVDDGTGSRPGYVTAGELKDNLNTYLPDLTLTAENVETTDLTNGVKITGGLTGTSSAAKPGNPASVNINYVAKQAEVSSGDGSITSGTTNEIVTNISLPAGGSNNSGNSSVGSNDNEPQDKPEETPVVEGSLVLDTENRMAYISGYPDETVKPNGIVTREEVVTMFYRLLKSDVKNKIFTNENDFTDVDVDRWSNEMISTIANGGFVLGYENGSFAPSKNITRAEFATIIARLAQINKSDSVELSDISGHWAEESIKSAYYAGWIKGYEDGSFRPNNNITRAEVVTIINRMIGRVGSAETIPENFKEWSDNPAGAWFYYDIIEASTVR